MNCLPHTKIRHYLTAAIFLTVITTMGCGPDGPHRVDVSGTVNWKEEPIPSGYITFNPDVKKGNSGPQGVAWIKDGYFDTRHEKGKGVSPGEQIVTIFGFDGVNVDEAHPWGKPLFIEQRQSATITDPPGELTLIVPSSAPQYDDLK